MMTSVDISVAYGDGIGPEIMSAVLHILREAGTMMNVHPVEMGEGAFLQGHAMGISPAAWESFRHTRVLLKAPTTTSQTRRLASVAVTLRKTFDLYANVRPCVSFSPLLPGKHPSMNLVIIHENEEDLYAGLEYQQVYGIGQGLKLITQEGSEKTIRYACSYAVRRKQKKIACFTKSNILQLSDGVFRSAFETTGAAFPHLEKLHYIVDIGFARLATEPETFDVIVVPSVYGDILSDVAAQLAGSVGIAASTAIGDQHVMFEAIHGSAPRHAGRNVANPSGLLLSAVTMLNYVGQSESAGRIYSAWLKTLEDGIHTYDIFNSSTSQQNVGTQEFAEAVILRLGQLPQNSGLPAMPTLPKPQPCVTSNSWQHVRKELVGIDIFIDWNSLAIGQLAHSLQSLQAEELKLQAIFNRGTKVWPDGCPETHCVNHWCCRFKSRSSTSLTQRHVIALLQRLEAAQMQVLRTEGLFDFEGNPGYSLT